jgi:hypothetical protein
MIFNYYIILFLFFVLAILSDASQSQKIIKRSNFECNQKVPYILNYDFEYPIILEDFVSNLNSIKNCTVTINGTHNDTPSRFFLIKLMINNDACNVDSIIQPDLYLEITDSTLNSTLLNQSKICERFKTENFITIETKASTFSIKFIKNQNENESHLINSIIITPFTLVSSETAKCLNENDFICRQPSNICIDSRFKCDKIASCSDNSDELNCTTLNYNTTQIYSTSTSTSNASISSSFSDLLMNTTITTDDPHGRSVSKGKTILIGIIFVLVIAICILVGVWVYGRRKRKWREFIAQLDNNTEWEYEQLEDGPLTMINNSNARMAANSNPGSALDLNFLSRRYQNTSQTNDPNDDTAQDIVFDRTSKKSNIN